LGNYANAASDFTSVLNEDQNSAVAYIKRGYSYMKADRFKQAVNDFNKAIKTDPAIFSVYLQRAEAYAGQKEWGMAIKDMLTYLKFFNDISSIYKCGEYYYESGDNINALKFFNLCVKDDSSNPQYFKSRGKTYLKTSTYQFALSDLAQSLDLNPNDSETWVYMGIASIKSGDNNKGCSCFNKAKELGSNEVLKHIIDYCK
jgi:tetratricopeptide (TPR) repeat protein